MIQLLRTHSEPSLSTATSEPNRSLGTPSSVPSSVSTSLSLLSVMDDIASDSMAPYTQSPSLGYIPVAFPFVISSARSGHVSRENLNATQKILPEVPNLNLKSLNASLAANTSSRTEANSNQNSNIPAPEPYTSTLFDLLYNDQDDTSVVPPPSAQLPIKNLRAPSTSQLPPQAHPAFVYPSSQVNMSFEPSFQTHSTSVNANGPASLAHPSRIGPGSHLFGRAAPVNQDSVAFKIDIYELAAMTKRVKVITGPDGISARSIRSTRGRFFALYAPSLRLILVYLFHILSYLKHPGDLAFPRDYIIVSGRPTIGASR